VESRWAELSSVQGLFGSVVISLLSACRSCSEFNTVFQLSYNHNYLGGELIEV